MRVAYLLGSLSRGGTETLLLDVFRNAASAPFSFIGVHRKGGALQEAFYKTQPVFHQLSPKFPFDPLYLYRLRRLLKRNDIEVVHAQQSIDAVYAAMAVIGTSIQVVQTFHGYDMAYGTYLRFILRCSLKLVARNLFVSQAQESYYQQKYQLPENRCTVVYNGISFDKLDRFEDRSLREEFQIDGSTLLMGMVGNFVDVRDHLTVCRFLKALKEKGVDFEFLFVGKPSNMDLYRPCVEYCQENGLEREVLFVGSRTDVPNILHQLDAFVYATDHDTFGIAVVEAIAAGVPTFVNDWGVMREITDDGQDAILYETKNVSDLLTRFLSFLEHRTIYLEDAKTSACKIRKKYSIEAHLNNLYFVYKSLKR